MYIFNKDTAEIIDKDMHTVFENITTSPKGDIFLTDGRDIEILINKDGRLETDVVRYYPITPDELKFIEWNGNFLKISCYEFLTWEEVELYFDCDTMDWVENTINVEAKKPLSFKEKLFRFLKRLR